MPYLLVFTRVQEIDLIRHHNGKFRRKFMRDEARLFPAADRTIFSIGRRWLVNTATAVTWGSTCYYIPKFGQGEITCFQQVFHLISFHRECKMKHTRSKLHIYAHRQTQVSRKVTITRWCSSSNIPLSKALVPQIVCTVWLVPSLHYHRFPEQEGLIPQEIHELLPKTWTHSNICRKTIILGNQHLIKKKEEEWVRLTCRLLILALISSSFRDPFCGFCL